MFQRHPCGVHTHMPGCARSGSSSQDIWCLPPAPPHPGRGPGGRGCRGRGQCGWGHSPYAKAARCPQASPSGQMHSGHPSLLSWELTCPEGQRAPGPHRQALVRPSGSTGSAPARPLSFVCVGVTRSVLGPRKYGTACRPHVGRAAACAPGESRQRPPCRAEAPSLCVSPCAAQRDGPWGAGGRRGHLRGAGRDTGCGWG